MLDKCKVQKIKTKYGQYLFNTSENKILTEIKDMNNGPFTIYPLYLNQLKFIVLGNQFRKYLVS